jgi:hypothetical protein
MTDEFGFFYDAEGLDHLIRTGGILLPDGAEIREGNMSVDLPTENLYKIGKVKDFSTNILSCQLTEDGLPNSIKSEWVIEPDTVYAATVRGGLRNNALIAERHGKSKLARVGIEIVPGVGDVVLIVPYSRTPVILEPYHSICQLTVSTDKIRPFDERQVKFGSDIKKHDINFLTPSTYRKGLVEAGCQLEPGNVYISPAELDARGYAARLVENGFYGRTFLAGFIHGSRDRTYHWLEIVPNKPVTIKPGAVACKALLYETGPR